MSVLPVILTEIQKKGALTIAEYMALALYHPQHGYYASASRRTGRGGDFYTSVDVSSLFGRTLAVQVAECWEMMGHPAAFDVVEAGAANGQLARDLLDGLLQDAPECLDAVRLHLAEASPAARAAQPATLGPHAARLVTSAASLPERIEGVVVANELLDALPVHGVVMGNDGLHERFVAERDGRLVQRTGPVTTALLPDYFERLGIVLETGWQAEVNLSALAWVARAIDRLSRGFLIVIDYGHPASTLYDAAHTAGTLTTYAAHVAAPPDERDTPPWLVDPGTRDITSHVDFTSVPRAVEERGGAVLGIVDQTYFLLALGLAARLETGAGDQSMPVVRQRLAARALMWPGGLGSTHKVLVSAKGLGRPALRGLSGGRLT